MWLVFVLMAMGIFIIGLPLAYVANKVSIAIQKDNDEYMKTKEKDGIENEKG